MTSEVTQYLDSLPYYDNEYNQEKEAAALKLVEQEMEKRGGDYIEILENNSLPIHIELFKNNELLQNELKRIENGRKLNALDQSRFNLNPPEELIDESETEANERWIKAVANVKAQLGHMQLNNLNQELMEKFGSNSWLYNIAELENIESNLKVQLKNYQDETISIHRQRKQDQIEIGGKLDKLEQQFKNLVNSTLQVDMANKGLEMELRYYESYNSSHH